MGKIILTGCLKVVSGELNAIRAELPDHISQTRAEPGCLMFEVIEDPNKSGRFHVHEEFVDRSAFERHQQRTAHSRWATVTANATRKYVIAEDA